MSDTEARIGYGTVLELALASKPSEFHYIAEMFNATPPSDTDDQVEATHFQSANRYREYIPGLSDGGETSYEMNYVPGSPTDRFLNRIKGKGLIARLTFPNGIQIIFRASRQGYEKATPLDDRMTATLSLKVSGEPIMTEPAAPFNLVAPSISGIAKVGVPLTISGGVWGGAMDVTYQWQIDGTDIVDAEGDAYVPVAGDVGKMIAVVVSGVNDNFTTDVTTDETDAVVA